MYGCLLWLAVILHFYVERELGHCSSVPISCGCLRIEVGQNSSLRVLVPKKMTKIGLFCRKNTVSQGPGGRLVGEVPRFAGKLGFLLFSRKSIWVCVRSIIECSCAMAKYKEN